MKPIFVKNNYQILVDIEQRRASIVKGESSVSLPLEELTPLSPVAAKHLRMLGCNPRDYLNVGHSNHVILKEAAPAWEDALAEADRMKQRQDTSMVHLFWQSLPGLMELRDAEDTYAACQKSASLMLEYEQRGLPPAQLIKLRQKYPRAAAYILAEAYAFSGCEHMAERGRKTMKILVGGGDLKQALALLPTIPPDIPYPEFQRASNE